MRDDASRWSSAEVVHGHADCGVHPILLVHLSPPVHVPDARCAAVVAVPMVEQPDRIKESIQTAFVAHTPTAAGSAR
jgi:hypothetical protein